MNTNMIKLRKQKCQEIKDDIERSVLDYVFTYGCFPQKTVVKLSGIKHYHREGATP